MRPYIPKHQLGQSKDFCIADSKFYHLCLSATLLTGYIQLTILTQDTDTKHSQDVGRLKSLHGVDFFVENGLHLSANGKKKTFMVTMNTYRCKYT